MHQIGGEKESTKTSPFLLNSPRIGESQNYGTEMKRLIPPMDGNRLLHPRGGSSGDRGQRMGQVGCRRRWRERGMDTILHYKKFDLL
jgi:hypothetical protein